MTADNAATASPANPIATPTANISGRLSNIVPRPHLETVQHKYLRNPLQYLLDEIP